jgi:L-threonylcarbamoyladenylate synthase
VSAARRIDLAAPHAPGPRGLADEIAAARLVCFPTDTVYGVGGRVAPAVREALIAAKRRDAGKPLQVVYPTLELLAVSLELEPRLLDAARRLLPGPFTLLLPYPPGLGFPPAGEAPAWHDAGEAPPRDPPGPLAERTPTLGVRVPAWPAAARALAGLPFPILASSANPSGGAAPRSIAEVDAGILAACDLILDAGPVSGAASTVVDLSRFASAGLWRILREGAIDDEGVAMRLDAGPGGSTRE